MNFEGIKPSDKKIVFRKSWRSELPLILYTCVAAPLSIYLTILFPKTIITGKLITLFGKNLNLTLPLLWFIPAYFFGSYLWKVFNVQYTLDSLGIETRTGILGMRQMIKRIRYEDIRSIEVKHTLIDRIVNTGSVFIGTAATTDIEIQMSGVLGADEISDMIQKERDRRDRTKND
jgi:uncharacterized membrane protein YdbT with pleckstrin-like domain